MRRGALFLEERVENGEGGIRTLEAGITRPRDFQSRSLSQLGHLSKNASEGVDPTRCAAWEG
jgi:hypothetical protein